jgi:endoglucanase
MGEYLARLQCILDVHNYARWNGKIIGQGGPTNDQFAALWTSLATKYAKSPNVVFGIMNEPHDLKTSTWASSVQAAVTAIRKVAPDHWLLIPGSTYSSAAQLPTEAGPDLLKVKNPDGSTKNIFFDVHKYLDV